MSKKVVPQEAGETIHAVDFEAPTSATAPSPSEQTEGNRIAVAGLAVKANAPWWHSQFNLMLCVFALLAVSALILIQIAPEPNFEESINNESKVAGNASQDQETPWDLNRRTQARTDSQAILSNLLASKKSLEEKEVLSWANEDFNLALDLAAQGDEFYASKDYQQAITNYQGAVDQLDSLYERIPELIKQSMAQGYMALDQGKTVVAQTSFSRALKLEPNSISAINALARANNLDQVLGLMQEAMSQQRGFEDDDLLAQLNTARDKLTQALTLDSVYKPAIEQLQIVESSIQDKHYRDAMTDGFAALFSSKFTAARNAFSAALKTKPDDVTANAAYQQSLVSGKVSSLQSLISRAARFESSEDWQNALSNYKVALRRDPNLIAAKLGEIRSSARSHLDRALRDLLEDPLALSQSNNKSQALLVLSDARAIRSKGPKLQGQIDSLNNALQTSDISVRVQLISDAETHVSLNKAGAKEIELGRFGSKNLALKPGRYVLRGVRVGFQDVRKQIELGGTGSGVRTIEIKCDKAITEVSKAN